MLYFIFGDIFAIFALITIMLGVSMPVAPDTKIMLLFGSYKVSRREDELEDHEFKAWRFPFPAAAHSDLSRR